jgi:hypothetical protein
MTRNAFLRVGGAAAASLWIRPFASAAADSSKFYFAIIADTHIIDGFYYYWVIKLFERLGHPEPGIS